MSAINPVDTIEVETGRNPTGTVIWLHGLGADGHDFEPIVPQLVAPGERALRFVFPNAPVRAVTINNGYRMPAWYDILSFDRGARQDEPGIKTSDATLRSLIQRENERGIATNRIVIGGFSQGGAMALYTGTRLPEKLAGIMGLSCYMLVSDKFDTERSQANQTTPVFMAHGTFDNVVGAELGLQTQQLLTKQGYTVEWHTYPMAHSVMPEEILHIAAWLRKVLGPLS